MRIPDHPIDPQFTGRWSPRGFDPSHRLSTAELNSLFEAARWAPSCFNEQPWIFYHEKNEASREMFLSFLTENNSYWVKNAGHIIVVAARTTFAVSGKVNPHARFDAGAAWMSLALQARSMGYYAHAMAGIQKAVIVEKLKIDESVIDVICAIAVGKSGDPAGLSEKHRQLEKPSERKPISEFTVAV